jgi:7-cyano-7-deazaguanine synthase in queuosine biosynthesis
MKVLIALLIVLVILIRLNKQINNYLDNKKNILVMFSGGLDSVTSLYYLLKNTKSNLYVHHIIIGNDNRAQEELKFCRLIIKEMKNIRDFEYSESTYDFKTDNIDRITEASRQDDLTIVLFQALRFSTIRNYLNINYIVISDCKYDKHPRWDNYANKFINTFYFNHWNGTKPKMLNVLSRFETNKMLDTNQSNKLKDIIKNINLPYEINNDLSQKQLFIMQSKLVQSKKMMYNYLPVKLRHNILSCRNSNDGIKCNHCFKCQLEKLYTQ